MHAEARDFVAQAVAGRSFASVVEIGSRNVNGTVRDVIDAAQYLGVDVEPGPGVDLVADGATIVLPRKCDLAVSCEVLEHTPDAEAIVANMLAMVRKGGLVLLTAACDPRAPHSATDGGPLRDGEFYRNIDADELREWLSPCRTVDIEVHARGDVYARAVR